MDSNAYSPDTQLLNIKSSENTDLDQKKIDLLYNIHLKIKEGADVFLLAEYLYLLIFIGIFGLIIFLFAENKQWTIYTTMAFLIGSFTSMICGFIGMKIATITNYRTAYSAQ